MRRLELRVPPPVVVAVAALLMWAAGKAVPALAFDSLVWTSVGLFAAGLAIGVGAFLQFSRANTTINPMTPHQSRALVTGGFYAWSRNPIYVADALALIGVALLVGNFLAFAFVLLFVAYLDRFQVRPEERALRSLFGAEYESYCRRVRRWL